MATAEALRDPMLQLQAVEFGWREDAALLSIAELQIARGERVFLCGPSGSGKSTLLALIGGVLEPRRGTICIDGIELAGRGRAWRDAFRADRIGYIFQMFNLVPYLSVLENVMLPARFSRQRLVRATQRSGSAQAEAARLLGALGLSEALQRSHSAVELSQGQQQRVAAARALFGSPPLIVADEPTSSLDAQARERFLELLMGECRRIDATLLFVSHDLQLSALFDRSIALEQINEASTPEEAA